MHSHLTTNCIRSPRVKRESKMELFNSWLLIPDSTSLILNPYVGNLSTQESAFVPQGHQSHKLIYIKKKIRPSSSNTMHFYSQFNLFCTIPQRYHIAIVGLPNNSYKPITNTTWVRPRLCIFQKKVHSTRSSKW
jgi:hypothetical protein